MRYQVIVWTDDHWITTDICCSCIRGSLFLLENWLIDWWTVNFIMNSNIHEIYDFLLTIGLGLGPFVDSRSFMIMVGLYKWITKRSAEVITVPLLKSIHEVFHSPEWWRWLNRANGRLRVVHLNLTPLITCHTMALHRTASCQFKLINERLLLLLYQNGFVKQFGVVFFQNWCIRKC